MELDLRIVCWLLERAPFPNVGLDNLTTMGSGPLPEDGFDSLLRNVGIEVYQPSKDTEVLVVGRERWSERVIGHLLDGRSGKHLRAYSQEMFLAYLISGEDPLNDPSEARYLAGDHPALKYLRTVARFQWPTTFVSPRGGGEIDDLQPESLLMHLGYTVRRGAPDVRKRHQILEDVYECASLPGDNFDPAYIRAWGAPRTMKRLKKMADTIAASCRRYKSQRLASVRAIERWEADLKWLRIRFHVGKYQFRWPSTEVG